MNSEITDVNFEEEQNQNLPTLNTKVDLAKFTPERLDNIKNNLIVKIDDQDQTSILNYGVETQNKLTTHTDSFLDNVRASNAGEVGEALNDLLGEMNYLDPGEQSTFNKIISKVPIVNKLVKKGQKMLSKYDSINGNIEGIKNKLDKGRLATIKDNAQLENIFKNNVELIYDMEEHIAAAYIKLEELQIELGDMLQNRDNYEEYQIQDKQDFISRLSKRINDMELTRVITVQSLPQIKMIQNNNNTMVEKIQSSITQLVPMWKQQVAFAVALNNQHQMQQMNEKIYDATNTVLKKNSELLKHNSTEIAKQNEKGIVATETLKQVNNDIISTIAEIKKIKEDGEKARALVNQELTKIEDELLKTMIKEQGSNHIQIK